jgi:2,4-dienoyl-CoA reductase-like NADH-dependent reductase (Old Yellow Enzyme family)
MRNRIVVSPIGTYSSPLPAGQLTDAHLMYHGHFAFRGAARTIVEGRFHLSVPTASPVPQETLTYDSILRDTICAPC